MSFKWKVLAASVFLLVLAAFFWFLIASDYSDAAASGSYELTYEELRSTLILLPDHTFAQELRDSRGAKYARGTWRRFGEGGIHFSPDFQMLPGQQGGEEDGSAYVNMERDFGIQMRLALPTYEVVWYGRADLSNTDLVEGRYETGGTHPRTLVLKSDHSFDQREVGWMLTADARGTWRVDRNGEVMFSREFLKPSGQPLADYEAAKAADPRGASFLQIEIADQKYRLSYRTPKFPWQ